MNPRRRTIWKFAVLRGKVIRRKEARQKDEKVNHREADERDRHQTVALHFNPFGWMRESDAYNRMSATAVPVTKNKVENMVAPITT